MTDEKPTGQITQLAPAKLNLFLNIVGRRDDGMHLLETLITFANVGDVIRVSPADDIVLITSGPFSAELPSAQDNLAFRAATAFAASVNAKTGARIELEKNLPIASGIGGGSADAAATLSGLCRLWGVKEDFEMLHALARDLGADVPACLAGLPVFASGIGECLHPMTDLPSLAVLLVNPRVEIETAVVYRRYSGPFTTWPQLTRIPSDRIEFAALLKERGNDLRPPAMEIAPAIADVLSRLNALPGTLLAQMSGSGATCFALFAARHDAEAAARRLRAEARDWWIETADLQGAQ